jgi:biopolymer transport protein ExbB
MRSRVELAHSPVPLSPRIGWRIALLATAVLLTLFGSPGLNAVSAASPRAAVQEEKAAGENAAPAKADKKDEKGKSKERKTVLEWLFTSLGWRYMITFLLLSFAFVALVVMNILSARRETVCPDQLVEAFEANLDQKQYQEAYELAKADESFLGNVLSTGLAKLTAGYPQAVEGMQEVGTDESMKLEHRLSYLALIGTISPMIGLFGTVDGMIASFSEIAIAGGTPDPELLAEGISMALVTTLIGLAIAIPAIAAYNILRNRIQRLTLEVGIISENLMSRFQNVSSSK